MRQMNQENKNSLTLLEIHKLLQTLDKFSDNELVQKILEDALSSNE